MASIAAASRSKSLATLGCVCLVLGLTLFVFIFRVPLSEEAKYRVQHVVSSIPPTDIVPLNTDFGVVIPKISANSNIIANVDPFNPKEYQLKLTQGVAHAKGTAFPGQIGNVFLFAHSSADFYEASRYNSVFYLLNKMQAGDEVDIYFQGQKYTYKVTGTKIVSPSDVNYLNNQGPQKTLTLMTCWPAGTSLKRLIVQAVLN